MDPALTRSRIRSRLRMAPGLRMAHSLRTAAVLAAGIAVWLWRVYGFAPLQVVEAAQ